MLLSSSSEKNIPSSKDLDALPLLHAVLMETLRLRAAIPGGQPRMTPYPSCSLGPFTDIPGGVRVGAQAHSVHRNAEVYPEPEKWDYMRWMDAKNRYNEYQKRERDRHFWAFSSGGRMCVGSNFAMFGKLKVLF
jgi:cytochrome P450